MRDSSQLLREYAESGSEPAFRELVGRYVDLVYSVACRRTDGDTHLAEDIVQRVFTDLARQARHPGSQLEAGPRHLGGWLHRHTCFVAANLLRSARRRQQREIQAAEMNALNESDAASWEEIAPELDEAVNRLAPEDRQAVLLRFYERRDLRAVGTVLGISADAAQKRVSRALDKLRELLGQRGVTLSVAGLGALLIDRAVTAAPSGLAGQVTSAAVAGSLAGAAGWLGALLRSVVSVKGALAVGTAVVALLVLPFLLPTGEPAKRVRTSEPVGSSRPNPPAAAAAAVSPGQPGEGAVGQAKVTPGQPSPEEEGLRLTILTADTGTPVPGVRVDYRAWAGARFAGKKTLWANRFGVCRVPFEIGLTQLELTTRSEGLADTRLEWRPDRGESIPSEYTVRLARAVPIGGWVVDADGQPVPGAKVGFNHEEDPTATKRPESHEFGWIEVESDVEGRWRINRIAEDMIHRLYGSARQPEHVNSPLLFVAREPDAEAKLRAETFVFKLGRGVTVRGVVVDAENQPVPGASVLVGHRDEGNSREGKAGTDGAFIVRGCRSGFDLVTAEAEGYAATTVRRELTEDSAPLRLVLRKGATFRFRVVDRQGLPVQGASIWLNTFGELSQLTTDATNPIPQVEFAAHTDAEGRAVWENAPDQELVFEVHAAGYLRKTGIKLRPDGEEHEIELAPGLVVEGTVNDADTGKPIPRFRMICGWPEQVFAGNPPRKTTRPVWSSIKRFLPEFAGGKFHHLLDEALIGGIPNPGYYFRFEAEGYAPMVSRLVAPDEGVVRFDVRLHRVTEQTVTVRLPNGRPARGVDIGLAFPGAPLLLTPSGFSRDTPTGPVALRVTDEAGQFRLPSDEAIERVIAASPAGYTEATPAMLTANPVLQLAPWGRVVGVFRRSGKPVPDARLTLNSGVSSFDTQLNFQAQTEATGRFVFDRAPPGTHALAQLIDAAGPGGKVRVVAFLTNVTVRAGETSKVEIDK